MSYTVANPGGAKPRPGTVSVAVILLYVAAALIVVSAGLSLYSFLTLDAVDLVDTPTGVDEETVRTTTTVVGIVTVVAYAAFGVAFAVLAPLVGKGRNPARIVTWTLGGIGLICCGCGLFSNAFSGAVTANLQGVDEDTIARYEAQVPGWLTVSSIAIQAIVFLALLVAVILLLLPSSNDYFRKEQEVWMPPTYPGYPGGEFPPPPPPQHPQL